MGYGIGDATNYVLFNNPLSKGLVYGVSGVAKATVCYKSVYSIFIINTFFRLLIQGITSSAPAQPTKIILPNLYELLGNKKMLIRIAGLSAASSIMFKIYYTYLQAPVEDEQDYKVDLRNIFETSNRVHFTHSLALLAVPLVKYPFLVNIKSIFTIFIFNSINFSRQVH